MKDKIEIKVNVSFEGTTEIKLKDILPINTNEFRLEELSFVDKTVEAAFILIIQTLDEKFMYEEALLSFSESDCMIPMGSYNLKREDVVFEFVPRKIVANQNSVELILHFLVN